ncbi:MAG: AAA family ATPase [Bacillota bacterium]
MFNALIHNLEKVILGKRDCIENLIIALLCNGHILIEDVPGVGKTTLAQGLAKSIHCSFSRIQFTPDLLPSDIVGVSIYNLKSGEFEFKKGPIHHQIVLADEINRTSPKTQSSLLEVMQEQQITVDGKTYAMGDIFMVIATQNPVEFEGTFPLPESQLDRFLLKISIGYPDEKNEIDILINSSNRLHLHELMPVITAQEIIDARKDMEKIFVSREVYQYIVDIVRSTRSHDHIHLGCSPRGTIALFHASKAYAYIKGKDYVTPDDVKVMAKVVLPHRLIIKPEAKYRGLRNETVIQHILDSIKVPVSVRKYE